MFWCNIGFWMIKIRRNVKRGERRKLGIKRSSKARREHGLWNFAAKSDPLRKSLLAAKWFCSLQAPSTKIFAAAKRSLGIRVPFRKPVHPFRSCKTSTPWNPPFRSWDAISKGVSQLRNHPLAYECHFAALYTHFAALYTHFAAAKWLRNLHALKSFSAHTMNRHVTAAPPLDTFRSLPKVHFMHNTFYFKSWEVRSPYIQTVLDLE